MSDKKQIYEKEAKTRLTSDVFQELKKYCDHKGKELGRKVTIAQAVRWVLESFLGVKPTPKQYFPNWPLTIAGSEKALVGPERNLAFALDQIDQLSTELREKTEQADKLKDEIQLGSKELLASIEISGKAFLSKSIEMVMEELERRKNRIDELERSQDEAYKKGENLMKILGVEVDANPRVEYEKCLQEIKKAQESSEQYLQSLRKAAAMLGRKDAYDVPIHVTQQFSRFTEDLHTRIIGKNVFIKEVSSRIEHVLDATELEGSSRNLENVPAYIEGWKKEVKNLEGQRDEFEKYMHDEVDTSNRLLEHLTLLKGEFEDWMSVLSVHTNRSFFGKIRQAFGYPDRITDADRQWASDEVKRINDGVRETTKPKKEEEDE